MGVKPFGTISEFCALRTLPALSSDLSSHFLRDGIRSSAPSVGRDQANVYEK